MSGMVRMEFRQGERPSFCECEGVFISFKLISPADPWPSMTVKLCLHGWILHGNPGNNLKNHAGIASGPAAVAWFESI